MARVTFRGQRGELRHLDPEGQEDKLGGKGLLANAVVLRNSRYLNAALVRASDAVFCSLLLTPRSCSAAAIILP